MLARCSSSALLAVRRASHSASPAATSFSRPAKASSSWRWVEASTSARSSCWPWISTSAVPTAFRVCTLIAWSLMKARVRPSASCTRRRIISPSSSRPLAARMAVAGWPFGTSNTAVTWPWSAPWRTRPASPRPPSASAKASSRMDLPAPVSPVSTARPRENSISSRSISTMSRIDRRASMTNKFLRMPWCGGSPHDRDSRASRSKSHQGIADWRYVADSTRACEGARQPLAGSAVRLAETQLLEGPGNIGALVFARLDTAGLHEIVGVLVPAAVGEIVPEHGRRRLRLADDADRHVGLGQPRQRLLDVAGGLILRHHGLEAVDGGGIIALFHVIAADTHLLARELVARAFELGLGADGIFGGRIFANHLFERGDRLLGSALVAGNVGNLVEMRGRDEILRVSGIGAAGMQRHVARRGADAAIVVAGIVERVGRHQQRLPRPVGIRVLAVDFLEFLRCRLRILLLIHQVQALIVELVRGLIDEGVVLGHELVPERAGSAAAQGNRKHDQRRGQPKPTGASRYPA